MRFLFVFLAGLLLGAMPGAAEQAPSFDCALANNDAEIAVCENQALAELDVEMARLFGLAIADAQLPADQADILRAMQRGWIKGRDDCWKAGDGLVACVRDSYALRIAELRIGSFAARQEDESGISSGPRVLDCEGAGYAIGITQIRTSEALVVLQWLDQSATLMLDPGGQRSTYLGIGSDRMLYRLWMSGDAATLQEEGGAALSCRVEDVG